MKRREFVKSSLIAGFSCLSIPSFAGSNGRKNYQLGYGLSLKTPTRFFDGNSCFGHCRAGIIPGAGKHGMPRVVMTMNTQDLSGSDIFRDMYGMETNDLGKTWSNPRRLDRMKPHFEMIHGESRPVALSDFWPTWHAESKTLLGTGHTVAYTPEWKVTRPRPRHPTYSIYDVDTGLWSHWKKMELPDKDKFHEAGAGSTQRYDEPTGNILLPLGFHPDPLGKNGSVTVSRCSFLRGNLKYVEHGSEISIDDETRGLYEPSLTFFGDSYFLTIRHDKMGFVTTSRDGLSFSPIQPWKFDDGSDLGNYNTQQHWVTHSDALFLVYTRKGANNDHVFRHRAPLFIGQVDPKKLCVIRETERILVPERGARLGNFGITDVSEDETWVTVSEWMQPKGVEKYGSDGSVFVARLHWEKPNRLFKGY